jgi:CMP-N-acetylneuraminic acid synthetase
MSNTIVAIVPMRHLSERVLGKNFRPFLGQPLYHRIVRCLLDCREIATVMVDTDSKVILEDARSHFPSVVRYTRPEHLRDAMTPMNEVLLNSVEQIEADFYLQTHSTNPLLRPQTVSAAIRKFEQSLPEYDSLFSVTCLQTRLWDTNGRPMNHDPSKLIRTQDLEPLFEENSCIYLFSKDSLKQNGGRIGRRPIMFEIDRMEAQDIDNEVDFRIAEALALALQKEERAE